MVFMKSFSAPARLDDLRPVTIRSALMATALVSLLVPSFGLQAIETTSPALILKKAATDTDGSKPAKDKPTADEPATDDPKSDDEPDKQPEPKQEKPEDPENPPPSPTEDPIAEPATENDDEAADDKKLEDKAKDDDSDEDEASKKVKRKGRSISDIIEGDYFKDGLFKVYRDPDSGVMRMEIQEDQLDKEFIYFSHISDGVIDGGHFRGQYRRPKVLKFRKYFDRLELVEVNTNFYFDPDNPLSNAKDANISESVLSSARIEAESNPEKEEKAFLIRADILFLSEDLDQLRTPPLPGPNASTSFRLGKLNRAKSRITKVTTYPENLMVNVDYVYSNPTPYARGGAEVTDARNVTVSVQHLMMEMPDTDYTPRFDDPRVGYFLVYTNDMTSTDVTPYRDMIQRWDLRKKFPEQPLSEPVEPIVWWIENTTPLEIRPIIKAAAETWNKAFEKAGFQNVLEVKIQPDDAKWDADDVRYNVIRWTSSPTPLFGGYGPRFVNPRTGQILGADIMLEYIFLTNRLQYDRIYDTAAFTTAPQMDLGGHQTNVTRPSDQTAAIEGSRDTAAPAGNRVGTFAAHLQEHEKSCGLAQHLHLNTILGKALAASKGLSDAENDTLIKESIYYLVLHELGHTFGLNHNMKSSYSLPYDLAHQPDLQGDALTGSVMDYPAINFAPEGKSQAHYYTVKPGEYDEWAITFGYAPEMDDPQTREAHLAKSADPRLAFGNDADDMRVPGKGIDPRINVGDLTDQPITYATDRLVMNKKAIDNLLHKFSKPGESYQEMRNAMGVLLGDISNQGHILSRYIGGIYVDRAVNGQSGAVDPYIPVEAARQQEAMKALRTHIFAPDAFEFDPKLLRHIAIQRRGFAHFLMTEDPKYHAVINNIQAGILDHILHPLTLLRITDTGLYGNEYSLHAVMGDLTDAIFEDDARGQVNTYRQELQIHYIYRLISILKAPFGYDFIARSIALQNLNDIRKSMARWRGNAETRAHREHISFLIDQALDDSQ
ncbi:hypothetical protein GCM10017044_26320 [Kordiimonas sediminis]|uniref:DUF5117 domain-containing protein n=1 Tax=Kordiimonas sediminis TaxID=1735581 RepID=A0A919AYJ4_9PROT|nr:zinc-dependent metalloprotease [Kordiimonas sediminis]GHF29782.1 hypothetical protein GCM10017044_26320 [Kordiimonas sediminis]